MKLVKIFLGGIFILLLISLVSSELSSENYNLIREEISDGGGLTEGGNNSQVLLGGVSGQSTSTSYITQIGALYGLQLAPLISWISPTPNDLATVLQRWVYLNTTITDEDNHSAFFDWNGDLVGYWNFESTNSTGVFDNSSYYNFGTFQGSLNTSRLSVGKFGHSLELDGVGDGLITQFSTDSLVHLTFSFWVKPISLPAGSYSYIFDTSSGGGCGGRMTSGGNFEAFCYSGGDPNVVSAGSIPLNQWTHIVFIQQSNGSQIYKNGGYVTFNSQDDSSGISAGAPLVIGAEYNLANSLNGSIDEFILFNRSLSLDEIKGLYDGSQYRLYHNFTDLSNGIYNYSAYAIDSVGQLTIDSRSVNVSGNTAPTVSLVSPVSGNLTTDRTPTFTFDGVDAQGDSLVYTINISKEGGSICSDIGLDVSNYHSESYTPSNDFKCLNDNWGDYYIWSVRACENDTAELYCSDWTSPWNVSIKSLVSITLPTRNVNFGSMGILETKNTIDDALSPLVMENNGTVRINVSINASSIWSSALVSGAESSYFQSRVGDYSGKATWANTSWFNIPLTGNVIIINNLNYSDESDDLNLNLLLKVPADESPGNKYSEIILEAALSEEYPENV